MYRKGFLEMPIRDRSCALILPATLVVLLIGCSLSAPPLSPTSRAPTPSTTHTDTPGEVTELQTPSVESIPTPPSADISRLRMQPGEPVPFWSLSMVTGDLGWGTAAWSVFKTEDGGRGWQDVTPPDAQLFDRDKHYRAYAAFPSAMSAWVTLIDPLSPPEHIWIWTTRDAGLTWLPASPVVPLPGIEIHATLRAVDESTAWLLVDSLIEATADIRVARLHRTLDGGASWAETSIPTKRPVDMEFIDRSTGFIVEAVGPDEQAGPVIWVTRDGGTTWSATTLPPPADDPALLSRYSLCDRVDLSVTTDAWTAVLVECSQSDRVLYRSSDQGDSWNVVPLPPPSDGTNQVVWFNARSGLQLGFKMYRTDDGGESWTLFKTVSWMGSFSFADPQFGWTIAEAGPRVALVHTQDFGMSWEILKPLIVSATSAPLSDLDTSLSSPAPLGRPVDFYGTLLITVEEAVFAADGLVRQANPDNPAPSAGSQYLLVSVSIECTTPADGTCVFFDDDLLAVQDEGGVSYGPVDDVVGFDQLSLHSLDPGETIEGILVFHTPTDASALVLIFSRSMWGEAYFALH